MPDETRSSVLGTALAVALTVGCAAGLSAAEDLAGEGAGDGDPVTGPIKEGPYRLDGGEHRVGRLIPDLEFTTVRGETHRLSDFTAGHQATVIALTETGCPVAQKYLPRLKRLAERFGKHNVAMLLVNTSSADEPGELREYVKDRGIGVPYIHDPEKRIAGVLGAMTTTDAFVLDRARTLQYRGAVDDQYGIGYIKPEPRRTHLLNAVGAVREGRRPQTPATWAPGCELAMDGEGGGAEPKRELTYHGRIARIVNRHCVECHREGGIAPFSLMSYDDLVGHRGMVRKMVSTGRMPPWFAAEHTGPWANDRTMPEADREALLTWLEGDRPKGDPADAPVPPRFPDGWTIGEPDVVLELPEAFDVPADGLVPYKYAKVETDFGEDKWVKAMEIRPTQRQVVHHSLVLMRRDKKGPFSRKKRERDGLNGFFAAYVPGNSYRVYRDGLAKRLPAGATLIFQMHYTPNGRAVSDRTQLGLIFADEPPRHEVRTHGIANREIRIPAGAAEHAETAQVPVPRDIRLLSLMPHMHYRGKAFRYELVEPDGETRRLLDVPSYDFNWQLSYRFAEPPLIERGSRIEVTGWYDNSAGNPANPDPTRTVTWGLQSVEEMLIGYVEYYLPHASGPAARSE